MTRWAVIAVVSLLACGGGKKRDEWWREHGYRERHGGSTTRPAPAAAQSERAKALLALRTVEELLAAVDAVALDQLAPLWKELPESAARAAVAVRLAMVAEHRGELDKARGWLPAAGGAGKGELAARVEAIAGDARARLAKAAAVDIKVVAVLLPLSGPHAAVGRELQAAIEVAARAGGGGARLKVIDTRGDPDGAAAAVDQAVAAGAVAALGPVGERESLAAAARAVAVGLPIALLAPGQAAAPDAGVFRLWPAIDWEAGEAVRVAKGLGYDRVGILAPRDEQGSAEIDGFRAAARARGIEVVAAGQYDPTAGDLEPDLKAFLGLDPRSNRRLARHLARHGVKKGWKTFSPDVEFDLLYIPDEHDRAALVVAYLPFFNVEVRTDDNMDVALLKQKHGGRVPRVIQLLGSSGWHHPGIGPRGGAMVEGALVIDVFAGGGNDEASSDTAAAFAEAFERRTGRPPGAIAAQAHDAALLLLRARAAAATAGATGARAALRRRLVGARLDDGACTPARVTADGGLERDSILLRVDAGELVLEDG